MRAAWGGTAAVALAAAALAAAPRCDGARARHLAVPVLADPSSPSPAAAVVPTAVECRALELGSAGGRVTALLPDAAGGTWVGTFDAGAGRLGGAPPAGAAALAGRRLMVNALAVGDGTVWAATQGGLVALHGTRAGEVLLGDEAVSALARAGGTLYAGTGHGLYRLAAGGAEPVLVADRDGEPLRVTALAAPAQGGRLWIGTSSGAYSIALAGLTAPGPRTAAWHPLVFGEPPAATNVVTALAALGGGAVAGTDDGGLVRLGPGGEVGAVRLADQLADQVNPGAAAASGEAVAVGTQGGGLLLARAGGSGRLEVLRPIALEGAEVSAVAAAPGGAWLIGTSEGRVLRVSCPP